MVQGSRASDTVCPFLGQKPLMAEQIAQGHFETNLGVVALPMAQLVT